MIPFLAGAALRLSPVGAFLKRIPRPVWISLAVASVIALGAFLHGRAVKHAHAAAYAQGKADEGARIAKKALAIKAKADRASAKITTRIRNSTDEQARHIASSADDLRLRGPGKAACPGRPVIPGPASGHIAAGGRSDAPATGLPVEDRIALPFAWAVNQAERCDLNRGEVLAWRDWHRQQTEAWKQIER